MQQSKEFIVSIQNDRIDKLLIEWLDMSRSQIQQLLKKECIRVNDQIVKANYKVKANDKVVVTFINEEEPAIEPENIPIDIVYEDKDIAVINKSSGMVVHPSRGHYSGTLVNALLYHLDSLSTGTGEVRPGIVHRIDKDTSGLLVVAKNNQAHQFLAEQLKEHTMAREYIALVHGVLAPDEGIIDAPIARDKKDRLKFSVQKDGKRAVTRFKVLKRYLDKTLVSLSLETGRTHQIRVHMQFIQHELVGDPLYGKQEDDKSFGQYLHAKNITFVHPTTQQMMTLTSELPETFKAVLEKLESGE